MKISQDTLIKLSMAVNYNRWIYDLCAPHLGKRLLETGCGIGNMTEQFLRHGHTIMATDIDADRIGEIKKQWTDNNLLKLAQWDVTMPPSSTIHDFYADTILCINMLEHIQDDLATLKQFYTLLPKGGRLLLYVPAMSWLYGTLDHKLDHFRRYTKKTLKKQVESAGFKITQKKYINSMGVLGWWLNGKILKKQVFSRKQIIVYDRLIPVVRKIDAIFSWFIGQSLMMVVQK